MKKYALSLSILTLFLSNFVFPAQILNTLHHFFPQLPQPTYDIACAAGSTALASTTNPTNGHLKAYLCVDNLGNVSVIGSGGANDALISVQTISPLLPPYNGIADAITVSPVSLAGGGNTITSSGLFTPAMNNKICFAQLTNDIRDGLPVGVCTFIDASHMSSSATVSRAFANQTLVLASQTFNAAETAAEAALATCASSTTTGQQTALGACVLQEPCGSVLFSTASGTSFFNSSAFTSATAAPIVVNGCPDFGTYFGVDCNTMSNGSALTSNGGNLNLKFSNIVIGNFGIGCGPTGGTALNRLVPLSGSWAHNMQCNDWIPIGGGGTGACISPTSDNTMWTCVYGQNDTIPILLFNRVPNLDNSCINNIQSANGNPAMILVAQEDGDRVIGSTYAGCPGIQIQPNAASPTSLSFVNVNVGANNSCTGLQIQNQTSNLRLNWFGGHIGSNGGGVIGTNITGVSIGTNAIFVPVDTQIDASGTGFNVNNSGAFWDNGGNILNRFNGAGFFTGTGSYLGYTKLTGSAYTNSTTTFSNVVGSTGQNFAWPAESNGHLTISCHLYYQAAATGGLNIEFTGPAGFTSLHYGLLLPVTTGTAPISSEASGTYSTSLGAVVGTAATDFDSIISFDLTNGATAGTVQLLAKSSAAVALTIQPGSYCNSAAR